MKKKLAIALGTATAAAIALPAFADHTIGGYYRMIATMENYNLSDDANPDRVVDQRLRARWQNNINEYVTAVLFAEVDNVWGKAGKGGIGGGGKQGTDGVDIEVKHAFLDLKVPGAPLGLAARLGLQPVGDDAFDHVLMDDDMAAATFTMKNDMMGLNFGWAKLDEGANDVNDDSDLFFVKAALTPVAGLKLAPQVWYARNQFTADEEDVRNEWYLGVSGSYKLAPVDLSAWFVYDFGTQTNAAGDDTDISAWALTAKASMDVAGAKLGLRGMYFPASSDDEDRTWFVPANGNNGLYEFAEEGSMIFLADALAMSNTNTGRRALIDAAYSGYGLVGGMLSASYTPPALKQLSAKCFLGYFMVADDSPDGLAEIDGSSLGTELAAQVFYKVADKVDVGLRGAYAFLGDAYDGAAAGEDPDDLYKAEIVVNVPY